MPIHQKPGFARDLCALETRALQDRIALLRTIAAGEPLMEDVVDFVAAAETYAFGSVAVYSAASRWYLQADRVYDPTKLAHALQVPAVPVNGPLCRTVGEAFILRTLANNDTEWVSIGGTAILPLAGKVARIVIEGGLLYQPVRGAVILFHEGAHLLFRSPLGARVRPIPKSEEAFALNLERMLLSRADAVLGSDYRDAIQRERVQIMDLLAHLP